MKRFVKVISAVLVLSILLSTVAFAGSNFTFTEEEHAKTQSQWADIQADDTVITLSVGESAGSIGFSWLSGLFENPAFRISENESMEGAQNLSIESSFTPFFKKSNKVLAENLEKGKTYWYSYIENGEWSVPEKFTVQDDSKYSVIFTSDSQIGRSGDANSEEVLINDTCGWQRTVRLATERFPQAAFLISAGDQTEHGFSLKQYKGFLSPKELRSLPLVKAIGNHDFYFPAYTYYSNNPNKVKETFAMPAGNGYYFSYGEAVYIVINSNDMYAKDAADLIDEAVKKYPNAKWRIAVLHHSAYSASFDDDEFVFERSVFAPVFDTYSIDLVLSGHDHMYSCSYPIYGGEKCENGTVYLQASSASGSNFSKPNESAKQFTRYAYNEEAATYTALEFEEDSLKISTYTTKDDSLIDSTSLTKNEKETKTSMKIFCDWIVSFFKTIISMF